MNIDELFKKIEQDRAAKAANPISFLVVGLGNPGLQYEKTRHNAGFMAADLLAKNKGFEFSKHKFDSLCGEFKIKDMRILVIKPETLMNASGKAVAAAKNFYKIPNSFFHVAAFFVITPS